MSPTQLKTKPKLFYALVEPLLFERRCQLPVEDVAAAAAALLAQVVLCRLRPGSLRALGNRQGEEAHGRWEGEEGKRRTKGRRGDQGHKDKRFSWKRRRREQSFGSFGMSFFSRVQFIAVLSLPSSSSSSSSQGRHVSLFLVLLVPVLGGRPRPPVGGRQQAQRARAAAERGGEAQEGRQQRQQLGQCGLATALPTVRI